MVQHRSKSHNSRRRARNRVKGSDVLTSEEFLLQPWFLPRRIELAIRALIPSDYRGRLRNYFDDYGCMLCSGRLDYGTNGMCGRCSRNVRRRLWKSLKRHLKPKSERHFDLGLVRHANLAQKLLRGFAPTHRASSEQHRRDTARSQNPVYEAFSPPPK